MKLTNKEICDALFTSLNITRDVGDSSKLLFSYGALVSRPALVATTKDSWLLVIREASMSVIVVTKDTKTGKAVLDLDELGGPFRKIAT
ncbi:hypothetical protein P43SY_007149 [Pythium insidiosum]|uniref:Uncharacterized protein n=1 Tax=Pythium insidiosum TaxID=114742 RepID=A0AAD5Q4I6_PYTIN|nr:hypothetical protein P43SY_007149 [Pythium insidiosum]